MSSGQIPARFPNQFPNSSGTITSEDVIGFFQKLYSNSIFNVQGWTTNPSKIMKAISSIFLFIGIVIAMYLMVKIIKRFNGDDGVKLCTELNRNLGIAGCVFLALSLGMNLL